MKYYGYLFFVVGLVAYVVLGNTNPLTILALIYVLPLTILASLLFKFNYNRIKHSSFVAIIGVFISGVSLSIIGIVTILYSMRTDCSFRGGDYEPCDTGWLWFWGSVTIASFTVGSILNYLYYRKKLIN